MDDALISLVIGIGKERTPVLWEGGGIHSKPMVLGGDETAQTVFIHAWLVMPSITIPVKQVQDLLNS